LSFLGNNYQFATHTVGVPAAAPRVRFQLTNHLGSSVLELDDSADADIITYEEYYPYGGTAYIAGRDDAETRLKRYRYSGKERDDETGLYYYGARYYAPWLGRWCSVDPAGAIDGYNLFRFCTNNPIVFTDRDGERAEELADDNALMTTNQTMFKEGTDKLPEIPISHVAPDRSIFRQEAYHVEEPEMSFGWYRGIEPTESGGTYKFEPWPAPEIEPRFDLPYQSSQLKEAHAAPPKAIQKPNQRRVQSESKFKVNNSSTNSPSDKARVGVLQKLRKLESMIPKEADNLDQEREKLDKIRTEIKLKEHRMEVLSEGAHPAFEIYLNMTHGMEIEELREDEKSLIRIIESQTELVDKLLDKYRLELIKYANESGY
jgi:RHS repeat-associated protein